MSNQAVTEQEPPVVVIGAGPAGLTAAYQLTKAQRRVTVLEADAVVGGISRTVERDGWRFDIGGHRFFTKVKAVEDLWLEILSADDFPMRPRMSRIFYDGKYFDYPLKPMNALRNLGPFEAAMCVASYGWARLRPPRDQSNLEGWISARFGRRLYEHFFKTYNEKVWGVPATEISADWAAQRIKNLSLSKAVLNAVLPRREGAEEITSLIEGFRYPKYGPGMMWERCRDLVTEAGGEVITDAPVTAIHHADGAAKAVSAVVDGTETLLPASDVISTMPLPALINAMVPPAPDDVRAAADALGYRDFLVVALVVPEAYSFPDNWIYVHSPDVKVGRIQNFGSWSPHLIKQGRTCLGLEYFVFEGDGVWTMDDDDLVELAKAELQTLGLVAAKEVERGYVVRMPKAYPVYDEGYQDHIKVLRRWIETNTPNVHPVGRNGMHKYNNQDHSMYTAMLTVANIVEGRSHDIWAVNVEADYHETSGDPNRGTGRAAPIVPRLPQRTS